MEAANAAKTFDDAVDAEDDAFSLIDYFDELDKFGQKRALACVRAATGLPPIIDAEPPHDIDLAVTALFQLNPTGQKEARKRIEELTEIPCYRAETAPQSTPARIPPHPRRARNAARGQKRRKSWKNC